MYGLKTAEQCYIEGDGAFGIIEALGHARRMRHKDFTELAPIPPRRELAMHSENIMYLWNCISWNQDKATALYIALFSYAQEVFNFERRLPLLRCTIYQHTIEESKPMQIAPCDEHSALE